MNALVERTEEPVLLSKKRAKVKVYQIGLPSVVLECNGTVADALTEAGVKLKSEEIRLNNRPISLETPLQDGDILTLVPKIEGA